MSAQDIPADQFHDDNSICDDLRLDRYRTGELDAAQATALQQHLERAPRCAARLAHLNEARAAFVALPPLVLPTVLTTTTTAAPTPAVRRAWAAWGPRVATVSSFAAAAAVLLMVRGTTDDTRPKGDGLAATVSFYVARGDDVFVADGTRPLHPNDAVRARVRSQGDGFVGVVEREVDGDVVSLLATAPMAAVHAGDVDIPGTAVLDAHTGQVSFIAVLCTQDITIDDAVLDAVGRGVAPAGCSLESHAFVKEPR
jgi:anti-sigma factor RsiW